MATVDDIGVPGQPLNTPPLTAWQAAVRDRLNSTKATAAVKAADQAGIASGGSAGFTATLSGLRVGQFVVAIISNAFTVTTAATSYTQATPTGLTAVMAPVPPIGSSTAVTQHTVVGVYTAAAASVSLGYTVTQSNAGAWTCKAQSSIALIAL